MKSLTASSSVVNNPVKLTEEILAAPILHNVIRGCRTRWDNSGPLSQWSLSRAFVYNSSIDYYFMLTTLFPHLKSDENILSGSSTLFTYFNGTILPYLVDDDTFNYAALNLLSPSFSSNKNNFFYKHACHIIALYRAGFQFFSLSFKTIQEFLFYYSDLYCDLVLFPLFKHFLNPKPSIITRTLLVPEFPDFRQYSVVSTSGKNTFASQLGKHNHLFLYSFSITPFPYDISSQLLLFDEDLQNVSFPSALLKHNTRKDCFKDYYFYYDKTFLKAPILGDCFNNPFFVSYLLRNHPEYNIPFDYQQKAKDFYTVLQDSIIKLLQNDSNFQHANRYDLIHPIVRQQLNHAPSLEKCRTEYKSYFLRASLNKYFPVSSS